MVELPPEIMHTICVALNGRSVTAFREVCRTWAIIGAEYLIPTVNFQLHPTSLLRLAETPCSETPYAALELRSEYITTGMRHIENGWKVIIRIQIGQ